jgi:Ca2+-binding RTX toxin-like protein
MAGLFGTGGPDSIAGTALDDLVSAGAGDDTPIGGQGNDPLFAGDAWAAFGGFYYRYISAGAPP